jgi:hypothetical protein
MAQLSAEDKAELARLDAEDAQLKQEIEARKELARLDAEDARLRALKEEFPSVDNLKLAEKLAETKEAARVPLQAAKGFALSAPRFVLEAAGLATHGAKKLMGSKDSYASPNTWVDENLLPKSWKAKDKAERDAEFAGELLAPWGKAKVIGQAIVSKAPKVVEYGAKALEKLAEKAPRTEKVISGIGRSIADDSLKARMLGLAPGLTTHEFIEQGVHPALAIPAGIVSGTGVNYAGQKAYKFGKNRVNRTGFFPEHSERWALQDKDIQQLLIDRQGKAVLEGRTTTPQSFGRDVQEVVQSYIRKHPDFNVSGLHDETDYLDLFKKAALEKNLQALNHVNASPNEIGSLVQTAVNDYATKNRKKWSQVYKPIEKELWKEPDINWGKQISKYASPLNKRTKIVDKNSYLKSPEGQTFLELLNLPPSTKFPDLEYQALAKMAQNNLWVGGQGKKIVTEGTKAPNKSIRDLTATSILKTDKKLSSILSPETRKNFVNDFRRHKKAYYSKKASEVEREEANRFFNKLLGTQSEIETAKNPAIVRQMAIEHASLGKYHGLPNVEQGRHMGQSKFLKQDILHKNLEKTNPELSTSLRKADEANKLWQERKRVVESLAGAENMTPEQTFGAVLSDVNKGAHNLKFVKGIAGKKAEAIADGIAKQLGMTGEEFSPELLAKTITKMSDIEKKIFFAGISTKTKEGIYDILHNTQALARSSKGNVDKGLQRLAPETYSKYETTERIKNSPLLQKRESQLSNVGGKDMSPEQTFDAIKSDWGKGNYALKFVKAIAGDKARDISEGLVGALATKGQKMDIEELYRKFLTLPKEDAKIFWMGLTPETKSNLDWAFTILDKIPGFRKTQLGIVNPVQNLIKKNTFGFWNRTKKKIFSAAKERRYSTDKGLSLLEERLLKPAPKAPWFQSTRETAKSVPRSVLKATVHQDREGK